MYAGVANSGIQIRSRMKVGDIVAVPNFCEDFVEYYGHGTIIKCIGRLSNRDCFLVLFARTGDKWGFYEDELQIASACQRKS